MIRPVLIALLIVAAAPAQSTRSAGTLDIVIRHGTSLPSATKIMTWEEAIRKSTSLPAATIGMTDRGLIAVGMAADVMVSAP
ncbi:MAG: amidohydrolase family protein [Acidobacteriota bacterium]